MAWLSVKEAAPRLDLSVPTVYELCAKGKLRHRRLGPSGGKIRVSEAAIEDYLRGCEVGEHNAPAAVAAEGQGGLPVRRGTRRPDGKPRLHLGF